MLGQAPLLAYRPGVTAATEEPVVRGLLRVEYDVLVDQGLLEGQHVELIEGAIVEVSPQGDPHFYVIRRLTRLLVPQVADPWVIAVQGPFAAGARSQPEPDVAVAREPGVGRHPTEAALLVEVTDTSRRLDLVTKPRIYGAAGVPVYAVVDLRDRLLRVHTGPTAEGYDEVRLLRPGQPLRLDEPGLDLMLDVADVLPPV